MKYFKFYPSDFILGTAFFTVEEVGVYIRLLCYQWDKGALPYDLELLEKQIGGKITPSILSKFKKVNNTLINERLYAERIETLNKVEKLRENGKKRGKNNIQEINSSVENKSDDKSGVKFFLRNEKINILPSEFLQKFQSIFLENFEMKSKINNISSESIRKGLDILDTDYFFYDFKNENHLKNAFKTCVEKANKGNITQKNKLPLNGSQSFD